ncbi:phenylacetate--CoA ligase family protein [Candidatus Roizmanbacteria bacterium]|nr:MAG: phenylacetate--CoA ligase family protein [Candidatus Roizmanbacteria bacterium]
MNNYITKYESLLRNNSSSYWQKKGEIKVLELFHSMAQRVPAYRKYLQNLAIKHQSVKTIADFKQIPPIDKENYLRRYSLEELCWDGSFNKEQWIISTTSGSTGEPFYFPRTNAQDREYALTAELYLRNNFSIERNTTLYINGFAMGAWIGGVFTYQAITDIAQTGKYPLSIISPGIFKPEIIKAINNLGSKFDQIIIGGYPPMIKDMIDDAIQSGIDWSNYNVGFVFSAEGFSEEFRSYIIRKAQLANYYTSTINHYGSVDLGTMAHETPLSIFIRKDLISSPRRYINIFNDFYRLPTLAQYNPLQFYFEEVDERLYCSAYSGIPLVRYDLKDHGGVYGFDEMLALYQSDGISLMEKIKGLELGKSIWRLPFVYVYERSDFIVKLYGANIYPETIRKVLNSYFAKQLTGKFTAEINYDDDHNQYLVINIEMKKGVKQTKVLIKLLTDEITKRLLKENSEFRSNYKESPLRQRPHIVLWEYESSKYFTPGVKQKWVLSEK